MNTGEKPKNTKKLNDSTKKNMLLFFFISLRRYSKELRLSKIAKRTLVLT